MSDVKRLLSEATPLPWTTTTEGHSSIRSAAGHVTRDLFAVGRSIPGGASRELRDTFHDLTYVEVEDGPRIALTGNGPKQTHNAELIVYAVNRLPVYEAAVAALADLLSAADGYETATRAAGAWADRDADAVIVTHIQEVSRAALARLRDEVPA